MHALQGSITSSAISVQGAGCVLLSSTHRSLSSDCCPLYGSYHLSPGFNITSVVSVCHVIMCVASTSSRYVSISNLSRDQYHAMVRHGSSFHHCSSISFFVLHPFLLRILLRDQSIGDRIRLIQSVRVPTSRDLFHFPSPGFYITFCILYTLY